MSSNRMVTSLAGACLALVALAACAPAVNPQPAVTASIEPGENRGTVAAPPEDPRPEVVWPILGTDAGEASAEDMARPALSIKIENSSAAKPQSNLQYADVVYEEYVEYGISRLVAIFHSQWPETVGPIRSMRPMDKNIMGSYEGPLIFSGAQSGFVNDTVAAGQLVITQDRGDYGFFRTSDKAAPHNLHGTLSDFGEQSGDLTTPPAQWLYAYPSELATATVEGEPVKHIDIFMSSQAQPDWKWDDGEKKWMRYERTAPHVTTDGTQLSATNVIVLMVDVRQSSAGGKSSVPETIMITENSPGYVVTNNHMVPITWSKESRTDTVHMTSADGTPIALAPGQTWVELVPRSGVGESTSVEFD